MTLDVKETIKTGDIAISLRGRNKGNEVLILEVKDNRAVIVDGTTYKSKSFKQKNIKHLKVIKSGALLEVAEKIKRGEPIADKKLRRAIGSI